MKLTRLFFVLAALCTSAVHAQSNFPAPGRPITLVVPLAAGGPTDVAARMLVPSMEKELGTSITIVNRPGASTQIGVTQIARAKPDGYTIGFVSLPQVSTIYLDPERQAVFARKDLQPLAMHVVDPMVVVVRADSSHKSMKDVIAFSRANPGKLRGGTGGFMGTPHLAMLQLERITGGSFSQVHFEGSAPGITALLGGHIDVLIDTVGSTYTRAKAGELRVLGIMDSQESPFLPGVRTLAAEGLDLRFAASRGLVAPTGTPKPVIDTLAKAIMNAIAQQDHVSKMANLGQTLRYMGPDEFTRYWVTTDEQVKPLIEKIKAGSAAK